MFKTRPADTERESTRARVQLNALHIPLQESFHPLCKRSGVLELTLPYYAHAPVVSAQPSDISQIASSIFRQLGDPKTEPRFWQSCERTSRMTVPKTTMHEDDLSELRKTRSGLPGRSETCRRNLCPHELAILLTRSSGLVSLLRTSAIRLLRSVRVSVSIASRPADGIARRCAPTTSSELPCGKSTLLKPAGQGKYSLFHRRSYF